MKDTRAKLSRILTDVAAEIVVMVRADANQKIMAAMGGKTVRANGSKGGASRGIKPCKVPGCGKPSKGPRFRFLCDEHRSMPQSKVSKLLAK